MLSPFALLYNNFISFQMVISRKATPSLKSFLLTADLTKTLLPGYKYVDFRSKIPAILEKFTHKKMWSQMDEFILKCVN